ncbi:MAG: hypothetical protein F7C07_04090 [Desulfurococcales archaeon]|nr:hypothetical protein [Desulfurococcales archaeon]
MNGWQRYADLLVYRALDSLLKGSRLRAEELFRELMSMWGSYGLKDAAFKSTYATYKLALAVYLYRALEVAGSDMVYECRDSMSEICESLSKLQRSDGSMVTDYIVPDGYIVPSGDANVETTSMVVLALYSNYPETIERLARRA